MEKYNILFTLWAFNELTGSELYVFEICKQLKKYNFNISICAQNIGGIMTEMSKNEGFDVYHIDSIPKDLKFDIIHCQHSPVTKKIISLYPKIPKICTIHSELYDIESPVINSSIKKYIAIRPQIKEHINKKYFVPEEFIDIIYNPIDDNRFNNKEIKDWGYYLFVGTIQNIRKHAIFDMVEKSRNEGRELWIVGKNHSNFLSEVIKNKHVKYFNDTVNIEQFVKNCYRTSGILMGRTTIEGWMCGKDGLIYNVDTNGNIIDVELHKVPLDLENFKSSNVINKIIELYYSIINK